MMDYAIQHYNQANEAETSNHALLFETYTTLNNTTRGTV